MADLSEFKALEARVEAKRREYERAKGSYGAHLDNLKKEYGVSGLNEAKTLLETLRKEEQEKQAKYDKAVKAFKAKYPNV